MLSIIEEKGGGNLEVYTDFSMVYDTFMDETPYEVWRDFISKMIIQYGISKIKHEGAESSQREQDLIVDLGCGTGTLTEMLAADGFDMIGVDYADRMLEIAMEKKEVNQSSVLYLHQDMRELDLYSTVGTIISVCDSINYIIEKEELLTVFQKVNQFLYPKGLFIFDFNTVYKYAEIIGDTIIAENREECSFIWENYYNEDECINEYEVTVFLKEEKEEKYQKFVENHFQKGYELEEILALVELAGLEVILTLDADTQLACHEKSERIYVVAREKEK